MSTPWSSLDWALASTWMPMVFFVLMGVAVALYAALDGYDLGVGLLMAPGLCDESERDMMIASIGPFWDANETWLVLGVGLLLIAFPEAHGRVLGELYGPVAAMLAGLMLRGVAFDFRAKAGIGSKAAWDRWFFVGSLTTSFAQGVMCVRYVTGFEPGVGMWAFACAVGAGVCLFYAWLGAGWLSMRAEGTLQVKAAGWSRRATFGAALTVAAVSVATPLASPEILAKWFEWPRALVLSPVPLATALLFGFGWRESCRLALELPAGVEKRPWAPFACALGVLALAFIGLGYSIFPYVAVGQLTMWQAAADVSALKLELVGVALTLPALALYTIWVYRVFKGKARPLDYH